MQQLIKMESSTKSKETSKQWKKTKARMKMSDEMLATDFNGASRIALIQMLIPIGLRAVEEALQAEVTELAGGRYSREGDSARWGYNAGSVYLGDQKVSIKVPRVMDTTSGQAVTLESYRALHDLGGIDDIAFKRVLQGISAGKYEKAAMSVPQTFGIKKSSISRKFIRASGKRLQEILNRSLKEKDIIAIFIDGKHFAGNEIIIAVGVTLEGEKIVLGFIESSTENHKVCKEFIGGLIDRGLNTDNEILFIIDGSKGLCKGIKEVLGEKAIIQRCQWHKRENVVSYLSSGQQAQWRRKLQSAYEEPSYEDAKKNLNAVKRELKLINESAVTSLEEGFEETLTLHRLGMFSKLGTSFKTTNCIETLNHQLGIYTDRVDYWKNSDQRQRWVGTALLAIEPRLRKVKGHKSLSELREKMKTVVSQQQKIAA